MRVGVDTGGTFTDVVTDDGRIAKVPSTPSDPAAAVGAGLTAVDVRPQMLAHGTTVATNALLERRGACVALVTNTGLADVIEIARQDRPSLYDQWADRPEPLVPRERRFEVEGRLDASGAEIEPISTAQVAALTDLVAGGDGIECIAVCLLHADVNPAHERQVASGLRAGGFDVSCSSEVSPQFREYERTVTTVVNAYLRPACRGYLQRLAGLAGEVQVMTSAGGLVPLGDGSEVPARLLLSGPAGGVLAGAAVAAANGFGDAVTFDMGGTSTDVCLVLDGRPAPAGERTVGGLPVRLPSLDVHTIGAGGGSVARIDAGGALVVGPASAGAEPGPACYGRGGLDATVTDADLVLGRIPSGASLPGIGPLDLTAARDVLEKAGVDPAGVITVVEAAMEQAVRTVSVARGADPAGLALVAFGGAGPLHACGLADALGMVAVVVPARAGVLSAVGMLCGPRQQDLVRSWAVPDDHRGLDEALEALSELAVAAVGGSGDSVTATTALDCRYQGQSHELQVPSLEAFGDEHRRRNGYTRPGTPIEVVALRASARKSAPIAVTDLALSSPVERRLGVGPLVIAEPDCTIWVPEGWRAEAGAAGALVLRRAAS